MDLKQSKLRTVRSFLTWTPKRCRYDPSNPPNFSIYLNLLFAIACTFTVRFHQMQRSPECLNRVLLTAVE